MTRGGCEVDCVLEMYGRVGEERDKVCAILSLVITKRKRNEPHQRNAKKMNKVMMYYPSNATHPTA